MHFNLSMSIFISWHSTLGTNSFGAPFFPLASKYLVYFWLSSCVFNFLFKIYVFIMEIFLAVCIHFECLELLWFHILIIVIVLMCAWPWHEWNIFYFDLFLVGWKRKIQVLIFIYKHSTVYTEYKNGNMIKIRKIKSCQLR